MSGAPVLGVSGADALNAQLNRSAHMDLDEVPPNPQDEWTVSARVVEHHDRAAKVEIQWINGRAGALPAFTMEVEWKPGSERRDVEACALTLAAQSASFLYRAFLKAAVNRSI